MSCIKFFRSFAKVITTVSVTVILFFNSLPVSAQQTSEAIRSFDAHILINANATINVTERITYDFGSNSRHGIFREIPLTAENGPKLIVNVQGVTDEKGVPYNYTISNNNNVIKIKIGDAGTWVSGTKTYVIDYRVQNAIRSFEKHDELYWNVTGDEWQVPISHAAATVSFVASSGFEPKTKCFTGVRGSTAHDCLATRTGAETLFKSTKGFAPGEGMTIVYGMPTGTVQVPIATAEDSVQTGDSLTIILTVLFYAALVLTLIGRALLSAFGVRFFRFKQKPIVPSELRGRPIIAEYEPPSGLTPIDVGTILNRKVDITDISSIVIDLAVRGYIKIKYIHEERRFWVDNKDFDLIKLKDGNDLTHPAEIEMFEFLFGNRESVLLSDLKNERTKFQDIIRKIRNKTKQLQYTNGYFDKKFEKRATIYLIGVIAALFISGPSIIIAVIAIENYGGYIFAALVGCGLIWLLYKYSAARRQLSVSGLEAFSKIMGFKDYLQIVEKERLAMMHAPDAKPETFEKFLPYAMVLGVEDKWAEKFESLYTTPPKWFDVPPQAGFSSILFINNIAFFDSSFDRVFNVTSPRSSSGFGGGGFSGGGSGGGGGGSW